ncbi:hypothetical protein ROS1_01490 [Roseibium sp. ROS1]
MFWVSLRRIPVKPQDASRVAKRRSEAYTQRRVPKRQGLLMKVNTLQFSGQVTSQVSGQLSGQLSGNG